MMSLLFSLYTAARRAVAAAYFREGSPSAIQTALKWDPANPKYYDAMGTLTHLYADSENSEEIVRFYERATRLSSCDAQLWADLGAGYDWAGRSNDALVAFRRARDLFPNSPDINWRLANFCVRGGKIPEALAALRMVLEEDSTARTRVFGLARNATRDRKALLEMIPPQQSIFFDYLDFLVKEGDIVGAEEVWARALQLNLPFDLGEAFPYLDALIQHVELAKLSEAWSALAQRFPGKIQLGMPGTNLVTNGSFGSDLLNGGFDWRVVPVEGAVVGLDSADAFEGGRALRITFDGMHNTDYGHVFQYVLVQPKTHYRFSGLMRTQTITTDSGPRFQVCDAYSIGRVFASTQNLVGTSGWLEENAEFTTLDNTHLLLLRVVRPTSNKLDNQIAGTVWIANVRLTLGEQ